MTGSKNYGYKLNALVIFRDLLKDPVLSALRQFCFTDKENTAEKLRCFSEMLAALYQKTCCLTDYIQSLVLEQEQICVVLAGDNRPIPEEIQFALDLELQYFQELATMEPDILWHELPFGLRHPGWTTHPVDIPAAYQERIANIQKHGYGIYAKYHTFRLDENGTILPVKHPDPITLSDLVGYERERSVVSNNTLALLENCSAANVLLYGDAGTGKSATIKAIANAYHDRGLRLIELKKDQLCFIPQIMDTICHNPLKFILFIDDLTLAEDDPSLGTLKATLEGSIAARAKNCVIYATSNRRHLMKETFDDGSDKHQNDTVQEQISLSARFGITITFSKPLKELYLSIVHTLAQQEHLVMEDARLDQRAEQFALERGGRSARAARQLIDQLLTEQNMERSVQNS